MRTNFRSVSLSTIYKVPQIGLGGLALAMGIVLVFSAWVKWGYRVKVEANIIQSHE